MLIVAKCTSPKFERQRKLLLESVARFVSKRKDAVSEPLGMRSLGYGIDLVQGRAVVGCGKDADGCSSFAFSWEDAADRCECWIERSSSASRLE